MAALLMLGLGGPVIEAATPLVQKIYLRSDGRYLLWKMEFDTSFDWSFGCVPILIRSTSFLPQHPSGPSQSWQNYYYRQFLPVHSGHHH